MASNHYTPNGGKNSSSQGWQYNDQGQPGGQRRGSNQGGKPPQKPGFNLGEWIPIIILFCIPSGVTQLIAFFWALSKVINLVKQNKEYQEQLKKFGRTATNMARDVTDAVRREVSNAQKASDQTKTGTQSQNQTGSAKAASAPGSNSSTKASSQAYSYAGSGKPASVKMGKKPKGGGGLIAGGSILTAVFGIGTIGALSDFLAYSYNYPGAFMGIFVLALFTCGGLAMLFKGIGNNRRKERILNYLAYIGTNQEVNLAHMAASFGVPVKKLCKDLRYMLSKEILPTGYLDLAAGKLFLTEVGYRAPEPRQEEASPTPEAQKQQDDAILREIRQVNDDIPDEVMSAKIDRIEEITSKILAYQKSHPERSSQLRSFLNYYLPTTLKILRAYAQLDAQGIEGENISAAKARIEGMMDQVVAGFEKQLDKLFQDQAMDISSDVQVLESMLKKDGLSDDSQNMTMTL